MSDPNPLGYSNEYQSGSRMQFANQNSAVMDRVPKRNFKECSTSREDISSTNEIRRSMFELFRTYDGEEYTVYMRDDKKRFYVDFEEQVRALYTVKVPFLVHGIKLCD